MLCGIRRLDSFAPVLPFRLAPPPAGPETPCVAASPALPPELSYSGQPARSAAAKAFQFGLRPGSAMHFTCAVDQLFSNQAQNFVSRSCQT
jgi:hypothetical protein